MKKTPYISKTVHNTVSIYIPYDWIPTVNQTSWTSIIIAMESWSVWKTNIGNEYTGWEFSNEFTPEMIKNAFKKVSGINIEIL